MPYVNIKITREGGTTDAQRAELIAGVTGVLQRVLGKDPETTFVVIDEVELGSWGVGGLPVRAYRRRKGLPAEAPAPSPPGGAGPPAGGAPGRSDGGARSS